MPSNVEIKAKIKDFTSFLSRAAEVSGQDGQIIKQKDIFFNCSNGRLKLRCFGDSKAELIFYTRPDETGPKLSQYSRLEVDNPDGMRETLKMAYGIKGEVCKTRTLFIIGQTRIHADEVAGLGTFMELEVEMKNGQSVDEGQKIAYDLMNLLGVSEKDLLVGAYMDLILRKATQNGDH